MARDRNNKSALFSPRHPPHQTKKLTQVVHPGSDNAMVFISSDSTVFIKVERLQLIFVKDGKDKNQ